MGLLAKVGVGDDESGHELNHRLGFQIGLFLPFRQADGPLARELSKETGSGRWCAR